MRGSFGRPHLRRLLGAVQFLALATSPALAAPDAARLFDDLCLARAPAFADLPERLPPGFRPVEETLARTRHILPPATVEAWWSGRPDEKSTADVEVQRVRGRIGPYAAAGCTVRSLTMTRAEAEKALADPLRDATFLYEERSDIVGNGRTFLLARSWGGDRYALLTLVWFDGVFGRPPQGAILVLETIDFGDVDPSADSSVDTDGLLGALMGILTARPLRL